MLNKSKLSKIFIISLIFITFIGCDDNDDWIPNVRVEINLSPAELATMGLLQTRIFPNDGVNGVILFRLGNTEFNAYDRTCSFQPVENCIVEIDGSELFAKCPCCNSEFELLNGDIRKGPAKRPLKKYSTSVSDGRLFIYN